MLRALPTLNIFLEWGRNIWWRAVLFRSAFMSSRLLNSCWACLLTSSYACQQIKAKSTWKKLQKHHLSYRLYMFHLKVLKRPSYKLVHSKLLPCYLSCLLQAFQKIWGSIQNAGQPKKVVWHCMQFIIFQYRYDPSFKLYSWKQPSKKVLRNHANTETPAEKIICWKKLKAVR